MHNQTSNLEIDFKTLQIARKTIPAFCFVPLVGSVSNDDGDSNENGEKTNRFNNQNNNFTRATHFAHFFAVAARLENA